MNVEKVSASRVKQYLSCPQQYYFDRHSDKEPEEFCSDDTPLHMGSIIHKVLEKLRVRPKKEIIPELVHEINEEYEEYILSPEETQEIVDMLEEWLETRDLGYEILSIEEYFKIPIKGFYLTGKIDVVEKINDSELRVTDYKTGTSFKDKQDLKESKQLKFYTLAAMEKYGMDNVEVAYDQTRFDSPEYIQYSRDDMVGFLQYIVSLRNKIKKDKLHKAKPGWHCAWCDYTHHCPIMQKEIEELEIDGFSYEKMASKYQEIHGKIKVLKGKKKELKKMMIGKMGEQKKDVFENDKVRINKVQSEYTNYEPSTVVENVPEDELDNVLKVKKGKVDDLDLNKEQREEIEENSSNSFSNPYVRISTKEE